MELLNHTSVPHPTAERFLFEYKREVLTVFSHIIGLYELAHLSIACINKNNEVLFLSHTPAIEYHLITSYLWHADQLHDPLFYKGNQSRLWNELYTEKNYQELYYVKQTKHHFSFGFSIPLKRDDFYLIYSFATKAQHINPYLYFFDKQNTLIKMGNYCFDKLKPIIFSSLFNEQQPKNTKHLRLIT